MIMEERLLSIQALRGVAAVLVVFCHSTQYVSNFLPVHMERYFGYCFGQFGVDIFFVISGFIMAYVCRNKFQQKKAVRSFILKRAIRIFPMYWITLFFVLLIIIPSGLYTHAMLEKQQTVVHAVKGVRYLIENFFLIPPNAWSSGVSPIVAVSWTLFFEMFFYYTFGCLLVFNRKIYLPALCFIF